MTYPLGTGTVSSGVRVVEPGGILNTAGATPSWVNAAAATPSWGHAVGTEIYGKLNRSSGITVSSSNDRLVEAEIARTWNGFGGFTYLPSFPQLDRNETTYPHAT